jgi:adenylate cyclase class 2
MSEGAESIERELKFPDVDLDALRGRLIDCEAERVTASAFEENLLFDRNGELAGSDSLLRLRMDSQGTRLTYKGPPRFEDGVKVRVEHETRVGDAAQLRALLESLGYEVVRGYQKYREEWRLGGVTIALDHTPIGDFAEFEGDGAEKVAKRCHFDTETAETRNYLQLYQDYRAEHPDAPADMIFP